MLIGLETAESYYIIIDGNDTCKIAQSLPLPFSLTHMQTVTVAQADLLPLPCIKGLNLNL